MHTDELTYAVIGQDSHPLLVGGVLESYQRLSMALLSALRQLDVPALANSQEMTRPSDNSQEPICFEVPSSYEITVQGALRAVKGRLEKKGTTITVVMD